MGGDRGRFIGWLIVKETARPAPEADVRLAIKSNAVKLYMLTCPFASARMNV